MPGGHFSVGCFVELAHTEKVCWQRPENRNGDESLIRGLSTNPVGSILSQSHGKEFHLTFILSFALSRASRPCLVYLELWNISCVSIFIEQQCIFFFLKSETKEELWWWQRKDNFHSIFLINIYIYIFLWNLWVTTRAYGWGQEKTDTIWRAVSASLTPMASSYNSRRVPLRLYHLPTSFKMDYEVRLLPEGK